MANLASTYQNEEQWKESEELQVQVIEICKHVLGPEDPNTLASRSNLAATFMRQGRIDEAETILMHVSEVRKRASGQMHTSPAKAASVSENQESSKRQAESTFGGTTLVETQDDLMLEKKPSLPLHQCNLDAIEDEDCMSVESNDDDIASQTAAERTKPEILAARYFGLFLAELKELRPLHEEALNKLGAKRFRENYRRILKFYVLKLRSEAYSAVEKDIVRVLKSRLNRINIAERILSLIREEKENSTKPLDELISQPVEKQSLEAWASNAYGQPATDYEHYSDEDDNEDTEVDDHLKEVQFPNLTQADSFLRRSLSFQTLVLELRLLKYSILTKFTAAVKLYRKSMDIPAIMSTALDLQEQKIP
ncbi:hypothetical protein BJX99DRAFT_262636 [Aspergillus californicus]